MTRVQAPNALRICASCAMAWLCINGGVRTIQTYLAQRADADSLDVSRDFADLGKSCRVTKVDCVPDNFEARGQFQTCRDIYTYHFTVPESEEQVLSRPEPVTTARRVQTCPESCQNAHFMQGEAVHCWKARSLPVAKEYRCPDPSSNPECAKISDPKEDVEATVTVLLVPLGIALLLCGACFGAFAFKICTEYLTGEPEAVQRQYGPIT
mmetsp:Transcript_103846/g.323672  ORF Transcript_103846/g.323672 Transcript_103846/m.323672 type:complete len:210 (-) Transcript_103846:103-732(-)